MDEDEDFEAEETGCSQGVNARFSILLEDSSPRVDARRQIIQDAIRDLGPASPSWFDVGSSSQTPDKRFFTPIQHSRFHLDSTPSSPPLFSPVEPLSANRRCKDMPPVETPKMTSLTPATPGFGSFTPAEAMRLMRRKLPGQFPLDTPIGIESPLSVSQLLQDQETKPQDKHSTPRTFARSLGIDPNSTQLSWTSSLATPPNSPPQCVSSEDEGSSTDEHFKVMGPARALFSPQGYQSDETDGEMETLNFTMDHSKNESPRNQLSRSQESQQTEPFSIGETEDPREDQTGDTSGGMEYSCQTQGYTLRRRMTHESSIIEEEDQTQDCGSANCESSDKKNFDIVGHGSSLNRGLNVQRNMGTLGNSIFLNKSLNVGRKISPENSPVSDHADHVERSSKSSSSAKKCWNYCEISEEPMSEAQYQSEEGSVLGDQCQLVEYASINLGNSTKKYSRFRESSNKETVVEFSSQGKERKALQDGEETVKNSSQIESKNIQENVDNNFQRQEQVDKFEIGSQSAERVNQEEVLSRLFKSPPEESAKRKLPPRKKKRFSVAEMNAMISLTHDEIDMEENPVPLSDGHDLSGSTRDVVKSLDSASEPSETKTVADKSQFLPNPDSVPSQQNIKLPKTDDLLPMKLPKTELLDKTKLPNTSQVKMPNTNVPTGHSPENHSHPGTVSQTESKSKVNHDKLPDQWFEKIPKQDQSPPMPKQDLNGQVSPCLEFSQISPTTLQAVSAMEQQYLSKTSTPAVKTPKVTPCPLTVETPDSGLFSQISPTTLEAFMQETDIAAEQLSKSSQGRKECQDEPSEPDLIPDKDFEISERRAELTEQKIGSEDSSWSSDKSGVPTKGHEKSVRDANNLCQTPVRWKTVPSTCTSEIVISNSSGSKDSSTPKTSLPKSAKPARSLLGRKRKRFSYPTSSQITETCPTKRFCLDKVASPTAEKTEVKTKEPSPVKENPNPVSKSAETPSKSPNRSRGVSPYKQKKTGRRSEFTTFSSYQKNCPEAKSANNLDENQNFVKVKPGSTKGFEKESCGRTLTGFERRDVKKEATTTEHVLKFKSSPNTLSFKACSDPEGLESAEDQEKKRGTKFEQVQRASDDVETDPLVATRDPKSRHQGQQASEKLEVTSHSALKSGEVGSFGFASASGKALKCSATALRKAELLLEDVDVKSDIGVKSDVDVKSGVEENETLKPGVLAEKGSGFRSGGGKELKCSVTAMKKAERLFEEIQVEFIEEKSKENQNERKPLGTMCGFSTAGGKGLKCSESALKKAELLLEDEVKREAMIGETLTEKKPISSPFDKGVVGFSSASGKLLNISEKSLKNAKVLLADIEEEQAGTVSDRQPGSSPLDKGKVGFASASGKKLNISEKALKRAEKILEDTEVDKQVKIEETSEKESSHLVQGTVGFASASGKKLNISEKALKEAEKMLEDIEVQKPVQIENVSSVKFGLSKDQPETHVLPKSKIGSNVQCGFTSASGKNMKVSESALKKAEKLLEVDIEGNETNTTSSEMELAVPNFRKESGLGPGGFKSASGKSLKISPSAVKKAEKLFEESEEKGENILAGLSERDMCQGFSFASGKNIELGEKKLRMAEKIFADIEDEGPNLPEMKESKCRQNVEHMKGTVLAECEAETRPDIDEDLEHPKLSLKRKESSDSDVLQVKYGEDLKCLLSDLDRSEIFVAQNRGRENMRDGVAAQNQLDHIPNPDKLMSKEGFVDIQQRTIDHTELERKSSEHSSSVLEEDRGEADIQNVTSSGELVAEEYEGHDAAVFADTQFCRRIDQSLDDFTDTQLVAMTDCGSEVYPEADVGEVQGTSPMSRRYAEEIPSSPPEEMEAVMESKRDTVSTSCLKSKSSTSADVQECPQQCVPEVSDEHGSGQTDSTNVAHNSSEEYFDESSFFSNISPDDMQSDFQTASGYALNVSKNVLDAFTQSFEQENKEFDISQELEKSQGFAAAVETGGNDAEIMSEPSFGGFMTAGGSTVKVSERALEKARDTLAESEPSFGGFMTAGGSKVKVSERALEKARDTLAESEPSFGGFLTAGGSKVKVSEKALEKARDTLAESEPSFGGFMTAGGSKVKVSEKALEKARDTLADSEPSFGGFMMAGGSKVKVSEKALEKARDTLAESEPSFGGFMKAGGSKVKVSENALEKARDTLADSEPSFGGFMTAGGSKVKVSEKALEKARDTLADSEPSFGGFMTAGGSKVKVSEKALEKARDTLAESEPSFGGFMTAGGSKVKVSEKALEKARDTLAESEPSFGGFMTAGGSKVKVSEKALEKARDTLADSEPSFGGFMTAGGSKVKVSEKALEKARDTLADSEPSFGGFMTAGGSKVKVSEKALEKARDTLAESEPSFGGFMTAGGSTVKVTEKALEKARDTLAESEPSFGGFMTAGGSTVKVTEKALEKARDTLAESEPSFGGFMTAGGSKVKVSEKALEKARDTLAESEPSFGGFMTAGGSKVKVSERALEKARDTLAESEPSFGGFMTAGGSKVKVSEKALEKARDTLAESEPSFGGFMTAGGSKVKVTEKALEKARDTLAESEPSFGGFMTAGGSKVKVSEKALEKARDTLADSEPSFGGFMTAGGSKVKVSEKALEKARDTLAESEPSFGGFMTAGGSKVKVSEKALEKARDTLAESGPSFGGFLTAGGSKVKVSEKALEKARDTLADSEPSFGGFMTAGGSKVKVSEKALEKARDTLADSEPSFGGFMTAGGSKVKVSEKALEKARDTLAESEPSFGGFMTAGGSKVKVSEKALEKARDTLAEKESFDNLHTVPKSVKNSEKEFNSESAKECIAVKNDKITLSNRKPLVPIIGRMLTNEKPSSRDPKISSPLQSLDKVDTAETFGPSDRLARSRGAVLSSPDGTLHDLKTSRSHRHSVPIVSAQKADGKIAYSMQKQSSFRPHKVSERSTRSSSFITPTKSAIAPNATHSPTPNQAASSFNTPYKKKEGAFTTPHKAQEGTFSTPFKGQTSAAFSTPAKEQEGSFSTPFKNKQDPFVTPSKTDQEENFSTPFKKGNDSTSTSKAETSFSTPNKEKQKTAPSRNSVSENGQHFEKVVKRTSLDFTKIDTQQRSNSTSGNPHTLSKDISEDLDQNLDTEDELRVSVVSGWQEERMAQEFVIKKKKRQKIRAMAGSLYEKKVGGGNRKRLREAVKCGTPGDYSHQQLLKRGVSSAVQSVTSATAGDFVFNIFDHYSLAVLAKRPYLLVGDAAKLVPDDCGRVGKLEIMNAFLAMPGVDPQLISEAWIFNHYRWIVWKLAAMEVTFPYHFGGRCLTVENVMLQLKYRYDREIDHCQRSALKKIYERDDTPTKRMVLCVSNVLSLPENNALAGQAIIELTDGWYKIKTLLDKPLTGLLRAGKIVVGTKLCIYGSELTGSQDCCSPLEAPGDLMLKIYANSTRRARWDSKLGYWQCPQPFPVSLNSLFPDGGLVGCVDVVVTRVYPMQYMEKTPDGANIFRSCRMEEKIAKLHEKKKEVTLEVLQSKMQRQFEDEERAARSKRSRGSKKWTRSGIEGLQTGEEIYGAMEASPDPGVVQDYLSHHQMALLAEYQREVMEEKQRRLQAEFKQAVEESKEKSSLSRQVVPLYKVRVAGTATSDMDKTISTFLTVWRPSESTVQLLGEGKRLKIFNLSASQGRGWQSKDTCLTAIRTTQYQPVQGDENFLDLIFEPRECLFPHDLESLHQPPMYSELDVAAMVVAVPPDTPKFNGFDAILACDNHQSLVLMKFWGGLQNYGIEDLLKPGVFVGACNLNWRRDSRSGPIPCVYVSEVTHFSTKPHEGHLRAGIAKLRNEIGNPRAMVEEMRKLAEQMTTHDQAKRGTPIKHESYGPPGTPQQNLAVSSEVRSPNTGSKSKSLTEGHPNGASKTPRSEPHSALQDCLRSVEDDIVEEKLSQKRMLQKTKARKLEIYEGIGSSPLPPVVQFPTPVSNKLRRDFKAPARTPDAPIRQVQKTDAHRELVQKTPDAQTAETDCDNTSMAGVSSLGLGSITPLVRTGLSRARRVGLGSRRRSTALLNSASKVGAQSTSCMAADCDKVKNYLNLGVSEPMSLGVSEPTSLGVSSPICVDRGAGKTGNKVETNVPCDKKHGSSDNGNSKDSSEGAGSVSEDRLICDSVVSDTVGTSESEGGVRIKGDSGSCTKLSEADKTGTVPEETVDGLSSVTLSHEKKGGEKTAKSGSKSDHLTERDIGDCVADNSVEKTARLESLPNNCESQGAGDCLVKEVVLENCDKGITCEILVKNVQEQKSEETGVLDQKGKDFVSCGSSSQASSSQLSGSSVKTEVGKGYKRKCEQDDGAQTKRRRSARLSRRR